MLYILIFGGILCDIFEIIENNCFWFSFYFSSIIFTLISGLRLYSFLIILILLFIIFIKCLSFTILSVLFFLLSRSRSLSSFSKFIFLSSDIGGKVTVLILREFIIFSEFEVSAILIDSLKRARKSCSFERLWTI